MFDMAITMKRNGLTDFHQDHVGSGITQDYVAEFGRSVVESVVHKLGRTLSLHVHSQAKAPVLMTPLLYRLRRKHARPQHTLSVISLYVSKL